MTRRQGTGSRAPCWGDGGETPIRKRLFHAKPGAFFTALPLLLALLALPGPPGLRGVPGSAHAQSQLVEKVARVEVPIYDDNLDDAKSRAIGQGQQIALRSLLDDLVAAEWVTLFDKELRRRVFNRVDRYIASYRVQKLEPSVDRTRFLVVLSAQVNRAQLSEDLHDLSLPLRGDPPTPLTLFYAGSDPVLGNGALRALIEGKLRARLELLNFKVGDLVAVSGDAAEALGNPLGRFPERVRLLARYPTAAALFIHFDPAPPAAAGDRPDVGAKGAVAIYQKATGELLASFEQQERSEPLHLPARTPKDRDLLLAKLAEPLLIQMQPGAIQSVRSESGKDALLRLRVLGFRSVEEQELFERTFFRRSTAFERFSLEALGPSWVTYEGAYGGDRATLEAELRGQQIGEFTVRHVYWYNDVLELDVARQAEPTRTEMRLFPKEVRAPEVAALIDDYLARYSQLEIEDPLYTEAEDNGWLSRANPLPFNATVYAYVDSRSDNDVYMGEALNSGETVVLVWHRVGRTNLTPAIRFYDENGVLMSTFTPKTWLRYEYTLPKGQHRFYVEVGDRFGYLRIDTGGYLNFHYLFKVQRNGQ
jgi:hypothetical protein